MDEQTLMSEGEILDGGGDSGVNVKLNHEVNDHFRDFLMGLSYVRHSGLLHLEIRGSRSRYGCGAFG